MCFLKSASETILNRQVSDAAAFPSQAIDWAVHTTHDTDDDVNGAPSGCTVHGLHSCTEQPCRPLYLVDMNEFSLFDSQN